MGNDKKPATSTNNENLVRNLTNAAGASLLTVAIASGISTLPEQKRTNNIKEQGDTPEKRIARTIASSLTVGGATAAILASQRRKENGKENSCHSL